MTHICVSRLTIISSNNGLSPGRRQAIIWTNAGILLIGPLGTNFSEILFEIYISLSKKIHLKMSSGKWQPFCLGPNHFSSKICLKVICYKSEPHIFRVNKLFIVTFYMKLPGSIHCDILYETSRKLAHGNKKIVILFWAAIQYKWDLVFSWWIALQHAQN